MDAVIYTRVSTEDQAVSGLGLEAQLDACRKLCELRGFTVVGEYSDPGVSGRVEPEAREGLSHALAALRTRPGAVLVVSAVSRLTRRQKVLWTLLDEAGAYRLRLVSATEPFDTSSAMGRAVVGMIGVISQLEADLVSERTKAALAVARSKGTRLGTIPFWDKRPELLDKIRLVADAGYNYQQIADRLNLEGVPAPRGGKWHPTSVRRAVLQARKNSRSGGNNRGPASASEQGQLG